MPSTIEILNSTELDIDTIFEFYGHAVALQKKVSNAHWKGFDVNLVTKEIREKRQYKILVDGSVACVFMVSFNDPQIWLERDQDQAIYIHRIVTHPDFRGYGFVKNITNWAIDFAKNNKLAYIRLDTWANNLKLTSYYKSFGFNEAGNITISANSGLPKHYEGITLQLFEIKV